MSWWRRSRPVYAVDGVAPHRNSAGWDIYEGDTLAARPVVAGALARLPRDPALAYLPFSLALSTRDGREWGLAFGDEALTWFDLSAPDGSDLFEETLAAAAFTGTVERVDREAFVFTTTGSLPADVTLAHCLDICGTVFRRLTAG
ncbi:hypothetical protein Acy02nite_34680 [Actinoplanes cyaneus]|uniref:Uncharacterized protein n=1 Tax=Actinoplanes cyaneus TaxID=52696 RepID=A0A919M4G3_9ACTN|nr:hypothetical protein [Actinoplanes cyaneus]MCW2140269.1 hypothetical protein [Actinoplanes cyaneus]GID65587.1 hypothetical protein Acy02nite_34680 [Actinoplanes cyaneus]